MNRFTETVAAKGLLIVLRLALTREPRAAQVKGPAKCDVGTKIAHHSIEKATGNCQLGNSQLLF